MAKKLSAKALVAFLTKRCAAKDGYIMGSYGQNPKNWKTDSWWFTQYSGDQKKKALYWRDHAERVFDCQGLAEGYYLDMTGVDVNTRARNNYSTWCNPKGSGAIPAQYRVPGAAVFIHSASAGYITHVGFLEKPVDASKPAGDWYVIEARGVMYGVVRTKLSERGWNRWGLMTKYFDYDGGSVTQPIDDELGARLLSKGDTGSDVKALQEALISLNYSCGKYGADGDYGSATFDAVKAFQTANKLTADGVYGARTHAALMDAIKDDPDPVTPLMPNTPVALSKGIKITGSTVNLRTGPGTGYSVAKVAKAGEVYAAVPIDGWTPINVNGELLWVSTNMSVKTE